jgi:alpha-L-fucosidase
MADGTVPQNQKDILLTIGDWLKVNGEAIYGSRTWKVFGEGPTKQEKSGMFVDKITYTPNDVRYTKKGNTVYAIFLGWPGENKDITLESFSGKVFDFVPKVKEVSLLANGQNISFTMDDNGLHFKSPAAKVDDKAFVVKIETE